MLLEGPRPRQPMGCGCCVPILRRMFVATALLVVILVVSVISVISVISFISVISVISSVIISVISSVISISTTAITIAAQQLQMVLREALKPRRVAEELIAAGQLRAARAAAASWAAAGGAVTALVVAGMARRDFQSGR